MRKGRKGSTNCKKIKEGKEAMLTQRQYAFFYLCEPKALPPLNNGDKT